MYLTVINRRRMYEVNREIANGSSAARHFCSLPRRASPSSASATSSLTPPATPASSRSSPRWRPSTTCSRTTSSISRSNSNGRPRCSHEERQRKKYVWRDERHDDCAQYQFAGTSSTGVDGGNRPVNGTTTTYLAGQTPGSAQLSELAMIEASDSVSPDCFTAVGQYRAARTQNATANSSLASEQLDGSTATNSEVEQLNLLNAAEAQKMSEMQSQGVLQACLASQMAVANMQQRNAARSTSTPPLTSSSSARPMTPAPPTKATPGTATCHDRRAMLKASIRKSCSSSSLRSLPSRALWSTSGTRRQKAAAILQQQQE